MTKRSWLSRLLGREPAPRGWAVEGTLPQAQAPDAGAAKPPAEPSKADVPAVWQQGDVILDLYEVKQVYTSGGMGLVYRVHHRGWNVDLAVKSPRPDYFQTEAHKENFVRECETWVNLGLHIHIVSCYYVRTLGGIPRVFAEYVEGGSLSDWIRERWLYEGGPEKALERILDVAIQMAWVLQYAHEQGVVHQDVKPANVMMTTDGTAKVTDFGLAKARAMAGEVGVVGGGRSILVSMGGMTPAYCSPEQAAGEPVSRKTDIWSWGVSVLEMFVGEVTWLAGQVAAEALAGYLETGADDQSIPAMPEALVKLLKRCFQKNPADRPANMAEVAAVLQNIYEQEIGQPYPCEAPKPVEALADSLNNRALSLLDLGREEEGERLFDEALKVEVTHPELIYNRGLILWRSGRMADDALVKQLKESKKTRLGDWHVGYLMGLVHTERGDADGAVKELEEALDRSGRVTEVESALEKARGGMSEWGWVIRTFEGHSYAVSSVFISPDGSFALSGSYDKTLRLWELSTGQCIRIFEGHTREVNSVFITPDGKFALSGSGDKTLRLWELSTGQCIRIFEGHTASVNSVFISPDGRFASSESWDNTLRLWELSIEECVRIFDRRTKAVTSIGSCGLQGEMGLEPPTIKGARPAHVLRAHSPPAIFISPNGRFVLSRSDKDTLRLWELSTGEHIRTFEGHTASVNSVFISPDGRVALSGSNDKTVRLWNLSTGKCIRTFEGHTASVNSVFISPNGRFALSGSLDKTLRLWNLGTGEPAPFVTVQPHSSKEASEHASTFKALLEQANGLLKAGSSKEAARAVEEARKVPGYGQCQNALDLWHLAGRKGVRTGLRSGWNLRMYDGHTNAVESVFVTPDGRFALSGSLDRTLRLWELSTGQYRRTFKGHTDCVNSVFITPDGRFALSGSNDKTLRLWELSTGKCLRIFFFNILTMLTMPICSIQDAYMQYTRYLGHTDNVNSVFISPDGRFGLSGSDDKTIRLWELSTGKCIRIFEGHTDSVQSVFISPDGRFALSGSADKTLRLWELSTGKYTRIFEGHAERVASVFITQDGMFALSGSWDRTLRLWELSTGQCIRIFEGHTRGVNSVFIAPDGKFALSGSHDKTIRLWDLSTGKCIRIFEGHTDSVQSVFISPDGRFALSGSWDDTLRLWELDWNYEFPHPADWDNRARPYLETFLTLHTPVGTDGISRVGKPSWNESDFKKLLEELSYRGYGWLRPEGVRRELEKMARDWSGPPPLYGA